MAVKKIRKRKAGTKIYYLRRDIKAIRGQFASGPLHLSRPEIPADLIFN